MDSRRMLSLSLLVVLALLCLLPCSGGDDGNATALGNNKTDDGGIFGFSFSPLSFFFSSDDDNKEKDVPNEETEEKTAVQAEGEADNTDDHIDKDRGEDETSKEGVDDKNDDAVDKRGSDDDTAAADVGGEDRAEDTDEVANEIDRLKDDAKLDEFLDEREQNEDIQPKRSLHQKSSAKKDLAGSEPTTSRSAHNTSLALRDPAVCQQSPNIADLSQYLRTCQNCLVRWDRYQCPLHDQVLELKKWMTELQDLLSYGCRMDERCVSTDKCCHSRDPALGRAVEEMTQVAKEMYDLFLQSCSSCPRDGGWSEWCEWGSCSVSCGEGTRTRRRQCDNPTPKANGRTCQGQAMDSIPCSGPACCTDGSWSPWSQFGPCQATCGQGLQERTRTCSNPPPNHCGRTCPGPSSDVTPCETGRDCCVDGNWVEWSSWSSCPVTCGRGTVDRYRTCSNPAPNYCGQSCPGLARESRPCEVGDCCVNGNWAEWSSWSPCPVTCGRGTVDRYRTCNNPAPNYCGQSCPGPSRDMRTCEVDDCCVDGEWGSWQSWSTCSASCGSGSQSRMRRCDSPSPNFCGQRCPGSAAETKTCFSERECCVDGNWGQWQAWSSCSASCGLAVRERERRCNSPAPNYCGQTCPGDDVQEELCLHVPSCEPTPSPCVDGNWVEWSSWSPCPVTCGRGTVNRYRTCSNPAPNYCGQSCPGPSRDARICELDPCCVDGQWGEWWRWSSCSATCERGTRERTRSCDSPTPNVCGRTCSGPKVERDACDTGIPCPPPCVNGNWGQWERWGMCSVTCGQGNRERRRQCDNPAPNFCGQTCPGSGVDRDTCDTRVPCQPVCEDGNWGLWGAWSACPVTCGQAQRERRRLCDSPAPNYCGQTCPGPSFERAQHRCGPDEMAGNWGAWQAWGACSVTCGRGQQLRRRICDTPVLNECVRPCLGSDQERRECDREPCCVNGNWGQWERWGACSATCGQGNRERRRQCDNPAPNFCGQTCPGSGVDRDTCDTRVPCQPVCVDGNWGQWGTWGACPVTCGQGQRERRRLCDSPSPNVCGRTCPGPSFERVLHSCGPLEVDGNWGSWSTWSPCPVTCGQGERERRRLCDSPSPNVCGQTCPGPSLERTVQQCGPQPVDGQWGMWGSWSACPVTCGIGQVERRRLCDAPAPNVCGRSCPGTAIERDQRRCGPEPIDGSWGSWEQWGACSATCGLGRQSRRRRCDSPSANECGRQCRGSDVDIQDCNLRRCCAERQWSTWSQWSICSSTCGTGTRTRQRTCQSVGFGDDCGTTCPGSSIETAGCPGLPACEPPWGPWSPCSATCDGQGTRERQRQYGGVPGFLEGSSVETEPCRVFSPPCPRWSNWEAWCPCDCRKGISSRRRSCLDPSGSGRVDIQHCGSGLSREERKCDVREVCPVCVLNCTNRLDGNYTSCTSCRDYVQCRNGQISLFSCAAVRGDRYEWDAFIGKCRLGDSPSCTLQPCVTSCVDREDGPAPSCFGCSTYLQCLRGRDTENTCPPDQEFNAHSGQCEREMSPTCIRPITRRLDFMMGDAPADSYFDMNEDDAEERYEELLKETGMIAILGRDNQDARTLFKSPETGDKDDELDNRIAIVDDGDKQKTSPTMSKKKKKEVQCQADCVDVAAGLYQSCQGCDHYVVCTKHGIMRLIRCPRSKVWDDKHKKCRKHSLTCKTPGGSKQDPGLS